MLAAVVEQPGVLAVREVPELSIGKDECLVQILACALCNSTDRKLLDGQFRYRGPEMYPAILGHEAVGRVVACGRRVTSFKEGDLVLRAGASYEAGAGPGSLFGGLAEYGKVKDPRAGGNQWCQVVPPEIDPVAATMLITLKETLSWLQRWPVQPGESVVVLGSGPVGLAFAWFARLLGCHPVIVIGRRDEPLQRAQAMGLAETVNLTTVDPVAAVRALTDGQGADRVIEAIGDEGAIDAGLSVLGPRGRLGVYGIAATRQPGDMERRAVDMGLGRNEWALEFFDPREHRPHEHLLWLVSRGIVQLTDWFSHVVPLAETPQGFELLARREAFKVVVKISD
jgi:threonine dehydrogenase-like Zn-dependent dehydrogenase